MTISAWSSTAANNTTIDGTNIAEGCAPSGINDAIRSVMAGVRTQHEDAQWIDFGHTPTRTGNTTFTVTGDQTATYTPGRRIKCTDATTIYGYITSSVFGAVTTVTLANNTANLSAALSAVAVAAQTVSNPSTPHAFFHVRKTAVQAIADQTFTKLTWDTEIDDIGGYFDQAVNNRWTPPAGMVLLHGTVLYGSAVDAKQYNAVLYKNGAITAATYIQSASTGIHSADITLYDVANGIDYYEMYTWHNAGVAQTVSFTSGYTRFWGMTL